jgi:hypothetical protein
MRFFDWVNLIDVVSIVTIAAFIVALSISRPADEGRAEMAGIARAIVTLPTSPRREPEEPALALRPTRPVVPQARGGRRASAF